MISVAREISDLKAEFEGGSSFSVDWYVLLRKGAENLLDHVNPETIKRTVPIYGGLTRNLQVYFCPADVEVPSRLYSQSKDVWFDYMPPAQFYAKQNFVTQNRNKFTIEYVNGVRFIVVYYPTSDLSLTVDEMVDASDMTGDVTMAENTYNTLPGSTASLQGTFTDAAYTFGRVLDTPIDITDALRGVALVPFYIDEISKLASLKLRLYTDDTNYYEVITTQDSIGDYLRDGQNFARFSLANADTEGTPDPANITAYKIFAPQDSGESQDIIFGKLTVQKSNLFFLEYYSRYVFVDSNGAWSDTPASGYSINLNRDALGILHYEVCLLTMQAAAVSQNTGEKEGFITMLARKYQQYFSRHPSSEQAITYSILPDIPYSPSIYGEGFDDFGERIGEDLAAEASSSVFFADDETPSGLVNGVNMVYTLAHIPDPAASLVLNLNGQLSQGGVLGAYSFTLVGRTLTFSSPIDALFASLPFTASYRFTIQ